jgi:hypothetical protein
MNDREVRSQSISGSPRNLLRDRGAGAGLGRFAVTFRTPGLRSHALSCGIAGPTSFNLVRVPDQNRRAEGRNKQSQADLTAWSLLVAYDRSRRCSW